MHAAGDFPSSQSLRDLVQLDDVRNVVMGPGWFDAYTLGFSIFYCPQPTGNTILPDLMCTFRRYMNIAESQNVGARDFISFNGFDSSSITIRAREIPLLDCARRPLFNPVR